MASHLRATTTASGDTREPPFASESSLSFPADLCSQRLNTLALLEKAHKARGIPLLYSSDTYADDLPWWTASPTGTKEEGLLMIPYCASLSLVLRL